MSVHALSHTAYGSAEKALGTPRSIEYQVFAQVTGRMRRASNADGRFDELASALHENHKLWTTIMIDVANAENQLPDALRAQLFYLAEFTRAQTSKVLRREADIAALVEINTAVMRGLRGEPTARES
ncbi:MAG: flagellar biosynthesis regulator FlaF [Pseudomonadota bacterium]